MIGLPRLYSIENGGLAHEGAESALLAPYPLTPCVGPLTYLWPFCIYIGLDFLRHFHRVTSLHSEGYLVSQARKCSLHVKTLQIDSGMWNHITIMQAFKGLECNFNFSQLRHCRWKVLCVICEPLHAKAQNLLFQLFLLLILRPYVLVQELIRGPFAFIWG